LYEAGVLLVLAVVFALRPRAVRPGFASVAYVLAYAVARFSLEPLRGDAMRGLGWAALSTSQLVSIVLAVAACAVLGIRERRHA
jgi:prolipoprotein diacylglyceryltransferase